jgi:hypothetical protein
MTATTATTAHAQHIDMITMHAWEAWTNNGLNLDGDAKRRTERIVQDVVKAIYHDGIDDAKWLDAAVRMLETYFAVEDA